MVISVNGHHRVGGVMVTGGMRILGGNYVVLYGVDMPPITPGALLVGSVWLAVYSNSTRTPSDFSVSSCCFDASLSGLPEKYRCQ